MIFDLEKKVTVDESMVPFTSIVRKFANYVCWVGTPGTQNCTQKKEPRSSGSLTVTTKTTMELMEPLLDQG